MKNLPNETYIAIYSGLLRTYSERVYFDIINNDVFKHTQEEYFVSWLGDQRLEDRKLMNRIMEGDSPDYVDESKHILFEQITYKTFIKEFLFQANKDKTFVTVSNNFLSSINEPEDPFGEYGVQEFITFVETSCPNASKDFVTIFSDIYSKTQKGLAINWLTTIFSNN
jgi:hypothetical protein